MLHDLPTPSIEICAETFERNLRKLADYTKEHALGLRPHSKTHKSTFIGKKQMEAGAIGLTVAKVGEAKVMAEEMADRPIIFTEDTVTYALQKPTTLLRDSR